MREVLNALNALVARKVIQDYAIGGAIGASFYLDALQTEDVDAFVFLPNQGSSLVSLGPVYDALRVEGGVIEREHVRFGAWPLQILTDANALIGEAIREARATDFEGTPTRVFRAEHLCAIALQTGRVKDKFRVQMFLEQSAVQQSLLRDLAARYSLEAQFAAILGRENE